MKNNFFIKIVVISFVASLSACNTKPKLETPTSVLTEYVNIAMAAKKIDDKKKLLELTMGEANEELQKMSDKDFDAEL